MSEPIIDALAGATIAGGCTDCAAAQTVRRDALGLVHVTVDHEDGCEVFAAITAGRTAGVDAWRQSKNRGE